MPLQHRALLLFTPISSSQLSSTFLHGLSIIFHFPAKTSSSDAVSITLKVMISLTNLHDSWRICFLILTENELFQKRTIANQASSIPPLVISLFPLTQTLSLPDRVLFIYLFCQIHIETIKPLIFLTFYERRYTGLISTLVTICTLMTMSFGKVIFCTVCKRY